MSYWYLVYSGKLAGMTGGTARIVVSDLDARLILSLKNTTRRHHEISVMSEHLHSRNLLNDAVYTALYLILLQTKVNIIEIV